MGARTYTTTEEQTTSQPDRFEEAATHIENPNNFLNHVKDIIRQDFYGLWEAIWGVGYVSSEGRIERCDIAEDQ